MKTDSGCDSVTDQKEFKPLKTLFLENIIVPWLKCSKSRALFQSESNSVMALRYKSTCVPLVTGSFPWTGSADTGDGEHLERQYGKVLTFGIQGTHARLSSHFLFTCSYRFFLFMFELFNICTLTWLEGRMVSRSQQVLQYSIFFVETIFGGKALHHSCKGKYSCTLTAFKGQWVTSHPS